MVGARLRCILHDGNRIRDNRQIPKAFLGSRVRDLTKAIYATESIHYKGLGEEITAINGIRKQGKDGFQVYLAIIKGGEVIEMGLPHVRDSSGKSSFLNASNMRLGDLDEKLDNLPEDVELAIVWRLDRGMTQDIKLTEKSLINRFVPQETTNFSLLDEKPPIGCGGAFGGDSEAVYDLTQVFIYTGEQDDPIRLSHVKMAAPPESVQWDSSDSFHYVNPVPEAQRQAPAQNQHATDLSLRMCWQDCLSHVPEVTVEIFCEPDAERRPDAGEIRTEAPPVAVVMLVRSDTQDSEHIPPDPPKSAPPQLLNRTEERLVKALHARHPKDFPVPKLAITENAKPLGCKARRFPKAPALAARPASNPKASETKLQDDLPPRRMPAPPSLRHPAPAIGKSVSKQSSPPAKRHPRQEPRKATPANVRKRKAKPIKSRKVDLPKAKPRKAVRIRSYPLPKVQAEPRGSVRKKGSRPEKAPKARKQGGMPRPEAARKPKAKTLQHSRPGNNEKKARPKRPPDILRAGRTRAGSSRRRRSRSRTSRLSPDVCS